MVIVSSFRSLGRSIRSPLFWRKWICTGLTLAMSSQAAFGHLPQLNFWRERASARLAPALSERFASTSASQLASASSLPVTESSHLIPSDLLRFVRVKRMDVQNPERLVYLLEDIHLNEEAQRNMAGALSVLVRENAGRTTYHNDLSSSLTIGVEGTVGPFDFSPYRSTVLDTRVKSVADRFLNEGHVGAVGYSGLTLEAALLPSVRIIGLEDAALYKSNVEAYRAVAPNRAALEKKINEEKALFETDIKKNLRPSLASYLSMNADYQNGVLPLGAYAQQLIQTFGEGPCPLHLQTFMEALEMEKKMNFNAVDAERDRVLEKLSRAMTGQEITAFTAQSLAYRSGQITLAQFYSKVKALLEKHRISLREFPAFDEYVRYLLLADGINIERLYADLKKMESEVLRSLNLTKEETSVIHRAKQFALQKKLIQFSMTPEEWEEYKAIVYRPWTIDHRPNLSSFERFYSIAEARNKSMVENLRTPSKAILVAGGFHTSGLEKILHAKGISTVVLTPQISKVDSASGSDYLKVFLKEKSPLQKLFAGRKLFLALPEGIGSRRDLQPVLPPLRDVQDLFKRLVNGEPRFSPLKRAWEAFKITYQSINKSLHFMRALMRTYPKTVIAASILIATVFPVVGMMLLVGMVVSKEEMTAASLEPAQKTAVMQLIEEYRRQTSQVFETIFNGDAEAFRKTSHDLLDGARRIREQAGSESLLASLLAETGSDRTLVRDGKTLPLPPVGVREIWAFGGTPDELSEAVKTAVQERLTLFFDSFPPEQQPDVARFKNDVEIAAVSGVDLFPIDQLSMSLRESHKLPPDQIKEGLVYLAHNVASLFERSNSDFPDAFLPNRATPRIILRPRDDQTLTGIIVMHETGHGAAALKILNLPSSVEIFTEAITMFEILRTGGPSEEVMTQFGKEGASAYVEAAREWVKVHPSAEDDQREEGFERILNQTIEIVLDQWPLLGFRSYEDALDHVISNPVLDAVDPTRVRARRDFLQRQSGLFLGAILAERFGTHVDMESDNPYPALRELIQYANTTLSRLMENASDFVPPDPEREKRLVQEIKDELQAMAGLDQLEVRPWTARSDADRPQWRFTPSPPGSDAPAVLEYPQADIFHPDESLTRFRALTQGRIAIESAGVTMEAGVAQNAVFHLLFGTASLARAEQFLIQARPGLTDVFDRLLKRLYPNPRSPAAKDQFAKLPAYLQYLEAMLYEIRRGESDPRLTMDSVKTALEETRAIWKRLLDRSALHSEATRHLMADGILRPSEREVQVQAAQQALTIIKEQLWPQVQRLYDQSEHAALAQELWNSKNEGALEKALGQLKQSGVLPSNAPTAGASQGKTLEEMLKAVKEAQRQQVLDELAQQARDVSDPEERRALAEKAQAKLKEAESQLAQDLMQASSSHPSGELGSIRDQLNDLQRALEGMEKQIPSTHQSSNEMKNLSQGIQKQAQDISSKAGTEEHDSQAVQSLQQMAQDLLEKAKNLKKQTDALQQSGDQIQGQSDRISKEMNLPAQVPTQMEPGSRQAGENAAPSSMSNESGDVQDKARQISDLAGQAQTASDELEQAAQNLQNQLEKEPANDTPGVRSKARGIEGKAGDISNSAKTINEKLDQLENALQDLKETVREVREGLESGKKPEASSQQSDSSSPASSDNQEGQPTATEGTPPSSSQGVSQESVGEAPPSDPLDGLDDIISSLDDLSAQGQNSNREWSATSQERRQMEYEVERLSRLGFTSDQAKRWVEFLEPVKGIIETLSGRFANELTGVLIDTVLQGLPSGASINPADLHRITTDGLLFQATLAPGSILLVLMLLIDLSGSMGDPDEHDSKLYQATQAFAALVMSFVKLKDKTELSGQVEIQAAIYGYAKYANIPIFPFGIELTEKALFDAVQKILGINTLEVRRALGIPKEDRGATADVPTLQESAKALVHQAQKNPAAGVGLINVTDGNDPGNQPLINEVYEAPQNKHLEFLSLGVGEGAKTVEDTYKASNPLRKNVRALWVPTPSQLKEKILVYGVSLFKRMVDFARQQRMGSILFLIGSVLTIGEILVQTHVVSHGVLIQMAGMCFLGAAIAAPGLGANETKKVYEIKSINGVPHFVMWDKYGQEASLPIRQDTSKYVMKEGDVEWRLERHRFVGTNEKMNTRVEGAWLGNGWAFYEQGPDGVVRGVTKNSYDVPALKKWGIEAANESLLVKKTDGTELFHGQRSNGFWTWTPGPAQAFEKRRGSRVPVVGPVIKDGVVVPDQIYLTMAGKTRRVKLHNTFVEELVDMMKIVGNLDPASTNLALTGHKSTGKNTAVYVLAGFLEQPIRTLSLHAHTTEFDLRWRMTVGLFEPGTTERFLSEYYEGARLGDWALVDEATKVLKQGALTALNSMNQNRRDLLPDGTVIRALPSFRAFFLWNPPGGIYQGQDPRRISDFLSRLRAVPFKYPTPQEETELLMESVFGGDSEKAQTKFRPLVTALAHIAKELRDYADSSAGVSAKVPPLDTRQLIRTLKQLRAFPKLIPYLRDVFLWDYPLVAIPPEEQDHVAGKIKTLFDQYVGAGKFDKHFFTAAGDLQVELDWPLVDPDQKTVTFGNDELGRISLDMGNLPLDEVEVKEFLDTPENRFDLWCLAMDTQLGFPDGFLGEKGSGKTELLLFFERGLLRRDMIVHPQITPETRGDDILGTQEIKDTRSTFPAPPLQRAMAGGQAILFDEVTKAAPSVLATIHNVPEFGFVTFTSGKEESARPGFTIRFTGNLSTDHTQANNFSAEFSSRFRVYPRRPLTRTSLTHLIQADLKRLAQHASEKNRGWNDDLILEGVSCIVEAYFTLQDSFQRDMNIPFPPDFRQIHALLQRLALYPLDILDVEDHLLADLNYTDEAHKKEALKAMWPLAQLRLLKAAAYFGDKKGVSQTWSDALGRTLSALVADYGVNHLFPFVPTNQHVRELIDVLIQKGPQLLTLDHVATEVSNTLGVTNDVAKARVKAAVESAKLHLAISQEARNLAEAQMKSAVEKAVANEAAHSNPVDARLLDPLQLLGEGLIDLVVDGVLPQVPELKTIASLVGAFSHSQIEKTGKNPWRVVNNVLGLTVPQHQSQVAAWTHSLVENAEIVASEVRKAHEERLITAFETSITRYGLGPELALPLVRAPTSVAAAIIQLRNDELLEQWPTNEEVDAFVRSLSPSWILLTALNLESSLKTNLFPSADIPEDRLKEMIQASGLRDVTNQFIMPEDLERVKEAFVSTWVSLTPEDQALLTEEILTFGALIPGDAQAEAPAVESTDASSADPNVPTIALSKISAPSVNLKHLDKLPNRPAAAAAVDPTGKYFAVSYQRFENSTMPGEVGPMIFLVDRETGRVFHELLSSIDIVALSFSPDGTLLAGGAREEEFQMLLFDLGKEVFLEPNQFSTISRPRTFTTSSDGTLIIGGGDGSLVNTHSQWGPNHPTKITDFPIESVAYSPDKKIIAVVNSQAIVRIVNSETLEEVSPKFDLALITFDKWFVFFSPDGSQLISVNSIGTIVIWDWKTGRRIREFQQQGTAAIISASLHKDGRLLALGSSDNHVDLVDIRTGTFFELFKEPGAGANKSFAQKGVNGVAFTADGKELLIGSETKTLVADIPEDLFSATEESMGSQGHGSTVFSKPATIAALWDRIQQLLSSLSALLMAPVRGFARAKPHSFDWTNYVVKTADDIKGLPRNGDEIPGMAGKEWDIQGTPVFSPDGRHVLVWVRLDGKNQIICLDRAADGTLSHAQLMLKNGDSIPGMDGEVWTILDTPTISLDGRQVFVHVILDGKDQILRLDWADDGTLSNAKSVIKDGEEIPGMDGKEWTILGPPAFSPDGRQVLVRVRLDGKTQILSLDRSEDGTLSNAKSVIKDGEEIPGMDGKEWTILGPPAFSPDGRQVLIRVHLDGEYQILVLENPDGSEAEQTPEPSVSAHISQFNFPLLLQQFGEILRQVLSQVQSPVIAGKKALSALAKRKPFDWTHFVVKTADDIKGLPRDGDEIPGMDGKKWTVLGTRTFSPDGRQALVRVELDGIRQILALDRAEDGTLSNARSIAKNDDRIPGMDGKVWDIYGTPTFSPDGHQVLVQVLLEGKAHILSLDRAEDGTLSNAKVFINGDEFIPGMDKKKWVIRSALTFSPDGRQVLVRVELDGINQILCLDRAADGTLSNARSIATNGDSIPGMDGKVWTMRGAPTLSPDGDQVLVRVELDGNDQILRLDWADDGTLSNAKSILKDGEEIPDMDGKWNILGTPVFSPDGRQVLVFVKLDDMPQILVLENPETLNKEPEKESGTQSAQTAWNSFLVLSPSNIMMGLVQLALSVLSEAKRDSVVRKYLLVFLDELKRQKSEPHEPKKEEASVQEETPRPALEESMDVPGFLFEVYKSLQQFLASSLSALWNEPLPAQEANSNAGSLGFDFEKFAEIQAKTFPEIHRILNDLNIVAKPVFALDSTKTKLAVGFTRKEFTPVTGNEFELLNVIVFDLTNKTICFQRKVDAKIYRLAASFAFSPDGTRLAVARVNDASINIFNLKHKTADPEIIYLGASPNSILWNQAGLMAAVYDNRVWLFRPESPNVKVPVTPDTRNTITVVQLNADDFVAIGDSQGNVKIFNSKGTLLEKQRILSDSVLKLSFNPKSGRLSVAGNKHLVISWDFTKNRFSDEPIDMAGSVEWSFPLGALSDMGYLAGGRILVTKIVDQSLSEGLIQFWDTETGEELGSLKAEPKSSLLIGGKTDRLTDVLNDGTIHEWTLPVKAPAPQPIIDAEHFEVLNKETHQFDGPITAMDQRKDGVMAIGNSTYIRLYDPKTKEELDSIDHDELSVTLRIHQFGKINALKFSPNGRQLAALIEDTDGKTFVYVVYVSKNKLEIQFRPIATAFAISPDGKRLAFAYQKEIFFLSLEDFSAIDDQPGHPKTHDDEVTALEFAPNGDLISADKKGVIKYWDPAGGSRDRTIYSSAVASLSHNSKRNYMVVSYEDGGDVKLRTPSMEAISSGSPVLDSHKKHQKEIYSPDGYSELGIYIGGSRVNVNAGGYTEIVSEGEHTGEIISAIFGPNSTSVITGGADGKVIIHHLKTKMPATPSTLAWLWEDVLGSHNRAFNIQILGPLETYGLALFVGFLVPLFAGHSHSWIVVLYALLFTAPLGILWGQSHVWGTYQQGLERVSGPAAQRSAAIKSLVAVIWMTLFALILTEFPGTGFPGTMFPYIRAAAVLGTIPTAFHAISNRRWLSRNANHQRLYDLMPQVEPVGLADVGEKIIASSHHQAGLSVLEVRTDEEVPQAELLIKSLSRGTRETVVAVTDSPSVEALLNRFAQSSGLPLRVQKTDGSFDVAQVIQTVIRPSTEKQLSRDLIQKKLHIRLFAATDDWVSSHEIVVDRETVSVDALGIHVYAVNFLMGLLRDMGLITNFGARLERALHLSQLLKQSA